MRRSWRVTLSSFGASWHKCFMLPEDALENMITKYGLFSPQCQRHFSHKSTSTEGVKTKKEKKKKGRTVEVWKLNNWSISDTNKLTFTPTAPWPAVWTWDPKLGLNLNPHQVLFSLHAPVPATSLHRHPPGSVVSAKVEVIQSQSNGVILWRWRVEFGPGNIPSTARVQRGGSSPSPHVGRWSFVRN